MNQPLPSVDVSNGTPLEVFLTPGEEKVLRLLKEKTEQDGICPTAHEIGAVLGMHGPLVYQHLRSLIRSGAVRHKKGQVRAWKVVANTTVYVIPEARR